MAEAVDFPGSNIVLRAPEGVENVNDMRAFRNRQCWVSCWQLTEAELDEVKRTGKVFLSVFTGGAPFPVYVGGSEAVREITVDYGGTFPAQP